jgi:hypothetical protein
MKQVLSYISIVLLAIILIWIIKENEVNMPAKVYTVDTYYSYMIKDDETIDLNFYLNDEHPLGNIDSYMDITITNEDESKKLSVSLSDLKMLEQESYLGETYNKYMLICDMPSLNQHFYIEDAYLDITLTNQDHYNFYIGSLSLYYLETSSDDLCSWTSLSAVKDSPIKISRMHQITVEYDDMLEHINNIELGIDYNIDYELTDDAIILTIDYEPQLFYACPIIISFKNGDKQVINHFTYIKDFQVLKESGLMLYGYVLS